MIENVKFLKTFPYNVTCKLLNRKLSLTGNSHKAGWYKQNVAKETCEGY